MHEAWPDVSAVVAGALASLQVDIVTWCELCNKHRPSMFVLDE